jgi:hypothetical protein
MRVFTVMTLSNKAKASVAERMRRLRSDPEFESRRLDALRSKNRRQKIERCAYDILSRMPRSADPVDLVVRARPTIRQEILFHLFLEDSPLMNRVLAQLRKSSLG